MLEAGTTVGAFEILGLLGKGGMGEVYRARDTRLGRDVAIKALPDAFARDEEYRSRFDREAHVLASLNHPNVATVHEFLEHDGAHYLVMELVPGESLRERIHRGAVPVSEVVGLFRQMAEGLAAAHAAGVIHRDLKPDNLMISGGRLKILDFGLAKDHASPPDEVLSNSPTVPMSPGAITGAGVVMGTPMYMSPEQARARPVDPKTDVWSFGCCLYEALTGEMAFDGDTAADIIGAVIHREPDFSGLPGDCPRALKELLRECFAKDRKSRDITMKEIAARLDSLEHGGGGRFGVGMGVAGAVAAVVIAVVGVIVMRGGDGDGSDSQRSSHEELAPKVLLAIDDADFLGAYEMAEELEALDPDHPMLGTLFDRMSHTYVVTSDPPGAEVGYAPYRDTDPAWEIRGTTPLEIRVPWETFRLQFTLPGYVPLEIGRPAPPYKGFRVSTDVNVLLVAEDDPARDMIRIEPASFDMPITEFIPFESTEVGEFRIDRSEVTNAEYKEFVDAGGYSNPKWWTKRFVKDGKTLDFNEAMAFFVDSVGRAGPSGWELGAFPEGQADYPVGGVSWFEAAAYAAFRGKQLPTVYHWARATFVVAEAAQPLAPDIQRLSNLGTGKPAPVGAYRGVGSFGVVDMGGNVREWCANQGRAGYYTMGGSWDDPPYIFLQGIDADAWSRDPATGFRCVRYDDPPTEQQLARIVTPKIDFHAIQPISDDAYATLTAQAGYHARPLDESHEFLKTDNPHWDYERVSINAAYDERMYVDLFKPKGVDSTTPVVIFFPGLDSATGGPINVDIYLGLLDFVPKSGRTLVAPHWADLYEKADGETVKRLTNPVTSPEMLRSWRQDMHRMFTFIESRDDLRNEEPAFLGVSLGAIMGTYMVPYFDEKFGTAIYIAGGFTVATQAMFAQRTVTPFVMINGDSDYLFPVESKQIPMFELLATPAEHKKHVVLPGGHIPAKAAIVRESLLWLDKYQPLDLVPVE